MTILPPPSQNTAPIARSLSKRTQAAALAERIRANCWSNGDAGDALGCSEGTIRNRLDGDEPDKQMTVHELCRATQVDGPALANAIFGPLNGMRLAATACASAPDALSTAAAAARCAADIIAAAPDGFSPVEARYLLPKVAGLQNTLALLEAHLRGALGQPVRVATG